MYIDPFSYWLYTTNPREHALREAFLALNLPLDNAIEACIASKDEMASAMKDGCTVEQAVLRCVRKYNGNSKGENKPRELIYG